MARSVVLYNRIPAVVKQLEAAVPALVRQATFETEAGAKVRAPVRTGRLRNSYQSEVAADGRRGSVFTDTEYAPYVEFGTRRMRARPHLRPAFEAASRHLNERLRKLARDLERGR